MVIDLVQNLVYFIVMNRINIHEAKTHLSKYLSRLKPGERILVCRRNIPIAEIRSLDQRQRTERKIGLAKGLLIVPESFFEPLPDDVLASFSGQTTD